MRREDWPWFLGALAIVCGSLVVIVCVVSWNRRIVAMMENGYEETCYPGGPATYYHKAKQ
jgi:hypothetical protein